MSSSATSPEPVLQKILHFDSPVEVYTADACVMTCFDARFDAAIRKFLKRREIALFDQVKIPGSAKALGAPDSEGDTRSDPRRRSGEGTAAPFVRLCQVGVKSRELPW